MSGRASPVLFALVAALAAKAARADELGSPRPLEELVVEAERPLSSASATEVPGSALELRPHATDLEILRDLPGVVVAQHQGGGKAPQYLIRGFDADHGTDLAVFVDDLPVNLVSHAHGQGYADLNLVIPETIEALRLYKGPYFPQFGDLANAGALELSTKDEFERSFFHAEGGSFDTMRYVAGASAPVGPLTVLAAAQAYASDGPFEHPQGYTRYNAFTKVSWAPTPRSTLSVAASLYQGDWHGSGQIPLREVSAGRLDRFGAVDPTEGGRTDREDVNLHYTYRPTQQDEWRLQLYGSRYALALFSDFTFFKDAGLRFVGLPDGRIVDTHGAGVRPGVRHLPGDGIEQNDERWLSGGRLRWTHDWTVAGRAIRSWIATETRGDDVDLALYRQVRRRRFFTVNRLHVAEQSASGITEHDVFLAEWIRLELGLRGDVFFFGAGDRLPSQRPDPNFDAVRIDGHASDSILSPKANVILTPLETTDVYLNFGTGFHSNDARSAILGARKGSGPSPLVRSIGYEAGVRTRQLADRVEAAVALWHLELASELVFSGDTGSQESTGGNFVPAGKSVRDGVDFEMRYRVARWLFADYDLSWADPRFTNGAAIPLAPTLVMHGGLTAEFPHGFSAALRARFVDDRPANEDRSLTARGYTVLDLLLRHRWRNVETSLAFLNLTNTDWREAQFADASCTLREARTGTVGCRTSPGKEGATRVAPPADLHFTSGSLFAVRAGLTVFF